MCVTRGHIRSGIEQCLAKRTKSPFTSYTLEDEWVVGGEEEGEGEGAEAEAEEGGDCVKA